MHRKVFSLFRPFLTLALAILLMGTTLSAIARAQTPDSEDKVVIYFFWGDGCPHCAKAKPVLEGLAQKNPRVILYEYEVYNSVQNQQYLQQMGDAYGFQAQYVPTIFIGDQHWVGYNEAIETDILAAVEQCLLNGCIDAGKCIIPPPGEPFVPCEVTPTPRPAVTPTPKDQGEVIDIPLIGEVDLSGQSLLLSTLLIAFVDGVNPCSVWVLTMLLALTLHTGSRRKVIIIGLVFLTVTALIYALFIAGLFTLLTFVSFLGWIEVVVALIALFFAIVNIKDYFFYKEGLSFTIADEKKPGIFARMRRVLDSSQTIWGLLGATIVLAAGVSLVEFSCTAGFPVLWTNLLSAQNVDALNFILLLVVYMLIYQLDELVIFFVAVFTLRASKLEEKHGRILKLIGGTLMLTLALVMIFAPSLMSELGPSLIIFVIAFGIAGLVLLVHRVILPRYGIYIGTEWSKKRKKPKGRH